MPYEIVYEDEKKYIRVKTTGELTLAVLSTIIKKVAVLAKEKQCQFIVNDLTEAKLTNKLFDIYHLPTIARNSGIIAVYKRALVVGNRAKDFAFLETVFLNQGHLVKVFATLPEAEEWLIARE